MRLTGAILLTTTLLLAASPARAATVSRAPDTPKTSAFLTLLAEPGEANRIEVVLDDRGVTLRDAGAPLTTDGCRSVAPDEVRCDEVLGLTVDAGDGDDRVTLSGSSARGGGVTGGPGDDVLSGGAGPDAVSGGGGRDQVTGGGGDDLLADGDDPAAPDADRIDGGPGVDVVSYAGRTAAVTVFLGADGATPDAGQAGERDVLAAVEGAEGGSGDDRLRPAGAGARPASDRARNRPDPGLAGGPGDDLLVGAAGADRIDASVGRDRVLAGPGADTVTAGGGGADVDCGTGADSVFSPRPRDRLARCERAVLGGGALRIDRLTSKAGLRLRPRRRATVVVTLRAPGGRLLARRTFRPGRGGRIAPRRRGARALQVGFRAGGFSPFRGGFRLAAP